MHDHDVAASYRLLDVEPGASAAEIRKAYLLLVNVWHPDRFAHDDALRGRAQEKLQAINLAYEAVRDAPLAQAPDDPTPSESRKDAPDPAAEGRSAAEWAALGRRLTANPGRLRSDGEGLAWSGIANLNQFVEGLRAFHRALRLDPRLVDAWHGLGLAHLALGKTDEAILAFEEALRFARDNARVWLDLGSAYADRGRHPAAAAAFREVVRLRPGDAAAWYALGSACRRTGEMEEAAEAYRRSVRLRPELAEAWYALGKALAFPGPDGRVEPEEALEAFREAVRLRADLAPAWQGLGATLSGLRRHDEAIAALQQAVRLEPESVEAWYSLGVACRYALHTKTAPVIRESYARLKRLSPDHAARLRELLPYSTRLSLLAFPPRPGSEAVAHL
jgi:tetratricopeptide (TPR) repeat protein